MSGRIRYIAYGAAILTVLFAVAFPLRLFPIFLSIVGSMDLKIAPWFSGGETAFVIDRGKYQIEVYRPVYPALIGEGANGFVQLVWRPISALPPRVEDAVDLNRDGAMDCEVSFSNPLADPGRPVLKVNPKSPWVFPVHSSPTTSLEGVLIERVKDSMFVRIPIRKTHCS